MAKIKRFWKIRPEMRKKINYEKVTFLGGFGGEPPKKKEIRSLQLLRFQCLLFSVSKLRSRLRALQQDPEQNSNQEEAIILRIFKDKHI